jgi:hypothetical protein
MGGGAGTLVLIVRTTVVSPADTVWLHASSMNGVNAELGPWVRMTYPPHLADLGRAAYGPRDGVAFDSWILALGIVPFDRHSFRLIEVKARGSSGGSFVEDSTSWLQRRWRHERSVELRATGQTVVTDQLLWQPRRLVPRLVSAKVVR